MQIFLPNNKSKLEKHYGIGNVPIGDVNVLNIFESLVVLKNICDKLNTNSASGNRQVTFSEFYIICFLLQQISNNFKALPDHYVAKEEFKEIAKIIAQGYEWRAADRLSTTHVINLSAFYNKNKDNILGYVEVEFFDNNLLQLITQYCQSLLPQGQSLNSPEIQGTINNFQIDECMTEVTKQLPLTNDKNTESNISKDDFYRLLSFNSMIGKPLV